MIHIMFAEFTMKFHKGFSKVQNMTAATVFGLLTHAILSLTIVQKSGLFSSLLCPSRGNGNCYLIQGTTDPDNQWKLDLDKGGYAYQLEKPDLTSIIGLQSAADFLSNNAPKTRHVWNILLGLYDTVDLEIADLNFTKVAKRDLQPSADGAGNLPDVKLAKISKVFAYKVDGRGNFVDLIDGRSSPRSRRVVKNDDQIVACKASGDTAACSSYESCVNSFVKHVSCLIGR